VLLDMDGTLVDSDAAVMRAWRHWADERGIRELLAGVDLHGRPAAATIRELCPDLDADDVARAAQRQLELEYDDLDDITLGAGADDLLGVLGELRLPWAVVTSADRRLAAARLGAVGVRPPLLIAVEDVTKGKPDPEGYRQAAAALGVPIARSLVVEDSEAGLAAGRRSGAITAALRGLDGDLQIPDLGYLARALAAASVRQAP
jgi:sugar-phosphatase